MTGAARPPSPTVPPGSSAGAAGPDWLYIALGGNLPGPGGSPPAATLRDAAAQIVALFPGSNHRLSPLYSSAAWPDPAGPRYVNAVLAIAARPDPVWLAAALHGIEARFGRARTTLNAPRPLDLDIIDANGRCRPAAPCLPHPRATARRFVLQPLADLNPHWHDPASGQPIAALLQSLPPEDLLPLPAGTAGAH